MDVSVNPGYLSMHYMYSVIVCLILIASALCYTLSTYEAL